MTTTTKRPKKKPVRLATVVPIVDAKNDPTSPPRQGSSLVRIFEPGYQIIEKIRSEKAVREGRHPGSERSLGVVVSGEWIAIASELPQGYWQFDVEYHMQKLVGMDSLSSRCDGFPVRTEEEVLDWLKFFAAVASKVQPQ